MAATIVNLWSQRFSRIAFGRKPNLGLKPKLGLALVAAIMITGLSVVPDSSGLAWGQEGSSASSSSGTGDAAAPEDGARTPSFVIGTGPVLGFSFPTAGALCGLLTVHGDAIASECSVRPGLGSEPNLRAVLSGELDLAIVQSDWLFFAQNGLATFSNEDRGERLKRVIELHPLKLALVAGAHTEAESLGDLQGQRINLGPEGSVQRVLAEIMLSGGRLAPSDFSAVTNLGPRAQIRALCDEEIDAFVIPAVHPSPVVATAMNRCGARLLPVGGRRLAGIIRDNPYLRVFELSENDYENQESPVATFGLVHYLVAGEDFPEASLLSLLRALDQRFEDFKSLHAVLAPLRKQDVFLDEDDPLAHYAIKQFADGGGDSE